MENISSRLKKAMSTRNMSQADLVEKTKISKGALSSYISGRYIPKQNNILLLAEALDVSEDWLTGADVPMEASLIKIIIKQLEKVQMTMEDVSNKTGVPLYWLQHVDTFIPGELGDYEIGYDWITRVADVLGLPGSVLRTALARQETPTPDDLPQITAEEAFGGANTFKLQSIGELEPLSSAEKDHINKYRTLDPYGKSHVDSILDWETARITALKEKDKRITELEARPATIIELDARSRPHHLAEYFHDASAGGGIFILGNEGTSKIAVSDSDWDERTDYVIRVNGDSMMPDYADGDNVMVSQHTELNYGDVGIFVINGKAYIKEYSEAELISRNPESPNIPIHEFDNIVCMGKVIGKLKGEYKIIGG